MKKMVYTGGGGEITEKKSRFIAAVQSARTEQEALAFIAEKKKEHWDAKHNCYAYIIGKNSEIMRCSDDGEPAQTAGRPMLDVLLKEELYNVVVVVTRYFGGVLLGTGGLVRAYQSAVKAGMEGAVLLEEHVGSVLDILTDYNGYGKVEYLLREQDIPIQNTEFTERVRMQVVVERQKQEALEKEIADKTCGEAEIIGREAVSFGRKGNEIIIFEKST